MWHLEMFEETFRRSGQKWNLFRDLHDNFSDLFGLFVSFLTSLIFNQTFRMFLSSFASDLSFRTSAPGSAFGPSKVIRDPLGRTATQTVRCRIVLLEYVFWGKQHFNIKCWMESFEAFFIHSFAPFWPHSQMHKIQNWSWGNRSICCGWVPAMLGSIVCRACFSSWNFGGVGCKTHRFPENHIGE